MKKIISLFIAITLLISSVLCVQALSNNSVKILSAEDVKENVYPEELQKLMLEKISNGGQIYYGEGTKTPTYLNNQISTRSIIPTDVVMLPSEGGTAYFEMVYGNTYYSPYLFEAESDCNMKFFYTCGSSGAASQIRVKIINADSGEIIFNNPLDVAYPGRTIGNIPLESGESYYYTVTPLTAGESVVNILVYGE